MFVWYVGEQIQAGMILIQARVPPVRIYGAERAAHKFERTFVIGQMPRFHDELTAFVDRIFFSKFD